MKYIIGILYVLMVVTNGQFCPPKCACNDVELSVRCDGAGLTSIPILLNPRIRSLSLARNMISVVGVDELSFYTHLVYLDLSANALRTIEHNALERLNVIKIVKLNDNSLETIDEHVFNGMEQLVHADLSHNNLKAIVTDTFVNCHQLQHLNISYNQIERIDDGAFNGLAQLKELDMKQNVLNEVGLPNTALPTIYQLQLPSTALRPLQYLQQLDLSYQRLSSINNDAFVNQAALEALHLDHNRLESMDANSLTGLTNLRHLTLSHNQLYRVPTTALRVLIELRHMDLSSNPIESLTTSCFEGLARLQSLSIHSCPHLRRVEINAFSGLFSLNSLRLSDNRQLQTINAQSFERPNALRRLQLHGNHLTSLSEALVDWAQLDQLTLHNNSWACNCDLTWMRRTPRFIELTPSFIPCATPIPTESIIDFANPCPSPNALLNMPIPIQNIVIFTVITMVMAVVLICLCRYHERLFTACAQCGNGQPTSSASSLTARSSPYSDDTVLAYDHCGKQRSTTTALYGTQMLDHATMQRSTLPYRFDYTFHNNPCCRSNLQSATLLSRPLTIRTNYAYECTPQPGGAAQANMYVDEPCYASIPIQYNDDDVRQHQQQQQRFYTFHASVPMERTMRPTQQQTPLNRYNVPISNL